MKAGIRNILAATVICAVAIALAVCLGISGKTGREMACTGLKVTVLDSAKNSFVNADDIRLCLDRDFGEYIGKPLHEIDLDKAEGIIDKRSAVLNSEAFFTRDGILNIHVTQREPAIRFQGKTTGFYADEEGYVFPLQPNYTSHVTIVDGKIPVRIEQGYKGEIQDSKSRQWVLDILEMVSFMKESHGWEKNIVQISVQDNGDIILVPRTGNEKFIFGGPDNFEEKFARIEKYYTAIKPAKEDGHYSSVNVKYDGQIICRE